MTDTTKIPVSEALQDIKSGMDDAALMRKYRLSARGLQSLFRKLLEKGLLRPPEIDERPEPEKAAPEAEASSKEPPRQQPRRNPVELVRDIKAGMHDFDLMAKYNLSAKILQSIFDQLLESGLMDKAELDRRMPHFDKTVEIEGKEAVLKFGATAEEPTESDEVLDLSWECPVCGIYQTREYQKCPECGALVALLKRGQAKE